MSANHDESSIGFKQLIRLERVVDVVYALALWRLFLVLPRPDLDNPEWDTIWGMLTTQWIDFVGPMLAIIILIVYWLQSNSLFSRLQSTNGIHAGISFFQVFFVLFYLYAIGLSVSFGTAVDTRLLESFAAMLLGLTAWLGWLYACHTPGLVASEVTPEEARKVSKRNFAEPLTAALTIPASFLGAGIWELSWFVYPFLKWLFRR